MRHSVLVIRLAIFLALIASSILCAGWKWGNLPS